MQEKQIFKTEIQAKKESWIEKSRKVEEWKGIDRQEEKQMSRKRKSDKQMGKKKVNSRKKKLTRCLISTRNQVEKQRGR